jgi:uncharacterized membrane protein
MLSHRLKTHLFVFILLLGTLAAAAQSASVHGTVLDPTGAYVKTLTSLSPAAVPTEPQPSTLSV